MLGIVPESVEFFGLLALLLYPCVVLEVVDGLAVDVGKFLHEVGLHAEDVLLEAALRNCLAVLAVCILQLLDAGCVHLRRVGKNGRYNVILGELVVLRELDAAKDVRDTGDAEVIELLNQSGIYMALLDQIVAGSLLVKEADKLLAVLVVDIDDHITVLDIVYPRYVLVADTLYAVSAEAVVQQCRALESLTRSALCVREYGL